ncbi:uncharacterized protein LOC125943868 [Dermacentor silvarum]|uniref:uncharacterized protein LOC125943868 n=1 Tax=Dermacentor silvarum TaxID=543639 RepID=UPI002101CDB6|nr:uncharacterized protein LOC125943868 [Dermacentor silvarum]
MSCSSGAVTAALGRGSRSTEKPSPDYQMVLPQLPSGASVLNTIFIHGEVKAWPYRVEHFRDALLRLMLLPEVVALGAYQMNHVWAVTFSNEAAKKKILDTEGFLVKEHRCVVIDPCNQGVRLKLFWLLHGVPDEDVRTALAPFGRVTEVTREKWRVQGCNDKGTTTRSVVLKLKPGMTADDLPHQLRVAEDLALVIVPGRAPLCLRCRGTGHIRRECRVPRCGLCRRFGHDETQCVRTYANVAGPGRSEDSSELLMDQEDAEEAAKGAAEGAAAQSAPPVTKTAKVNLKGIDEGNVPDSAPPPAKVQVTEAGADVTGASSEITPPPTKVADEPVSVSEDMDLTSDAKGAGKRLRDDVEDHSQNTDGVDTEGPTPKTPTVRRSTLKVKPNVPPDRRPSHAPPPP